MILYDTNKCTLKHKQKIIIIFFYLTFESDITTKHIL